MISITNLIALPPLLLVSIPLAVSASVTIPLAFAILFLRGLIVYVELAVALLINFFLFPAHSPSSVSFLNVSSEVNTPGISPSRVKSRLRSAETSNVDYFFHTHHPHPPPLTPSSRDRFFNFITGDAGRDFEGLGGWRTPLPRKRNGTSSASSASSVNISSEEGEIDHQDDQAWLSINKRLELPSSSRQFSPSVTNPTNTINHHGVTAESKFEMEQQQPPQLPARPHYHKRSITTSSLVLLMPSSSSSSSGLEGGGGEQSSSSHSGPTTTSSPWRTALRASKSTVGLESLPSTAASTSTANYSRPPSHPGGVLEPPFFRTTTTSSHGRYHFAGGGRSLVMPHYYPVSSVGLQRRRRSSSSSSVAATGGIIRTAADRV